MIHLVFDEMSVMLGLLLLLSWTTNSQGQSEVFSGDTTIISYGGKSPGVPGGNKLHVQALLLDNETSSLIVGARNEILQIQYTKQDKHAAKSIKLPPAANTFSMCKSTKDEALCDNYVKVLIDRGSSVLACGTNAGQPMCWHVQKDTFELLPSQNITGVSRCPSDPRENVTSVQVGTALFTGVRLGPSDYGIAKTGIPALKAQVRTMNAKATFYDANFVSSFQADDGFLYFFFREVAMEVIDRNIVYSRVSRICPYDVGEPFVFEDKFITFLKSQLVCMKTFPSQPPVYYDLLQSTFHVHVHNNATFSEEFVYGIFTSSFNPRGGSAICRYRMTDVRRTFKTSPFLQKNDASGYWGPVQHPGTYPDVGRLNCTPDLDTTVYGTNSAHFATSHPLLADDVFPYDGDAVFTIDNASLTSLVVDDLHMEGRTQEVHILFASTLDGHVLKILVDRAAKQPPVLLEEIFVFQDAQPLYIMEINKDYIFVAGSIGVSQITLSRCHRYQSCSACVLSLDPYCGWSKSSDKCIAVHGNNSSLTAGDTVTESSQQCPSVTNVSSCRVAIVKENPGLGATLQCEFHGATNAVFLGWTKDGDNITTTGASTKYKVKKINANKEQLMLQQFTLLETGQYTCHVSDGTTSRSCSENIVGSSPTLTCTNPGSTQTNVASQCQCSVTGIPMPTVAVLDSAGAGSTMVDHNVAHSSLLVEPGEAVFVINPFGHDGFICTSNIPPVTAKPHHGGADCAASYHQEFVIVLILFVIAVLVCLILLACACCARIRDDDQEDIRIRSTQWRVLGSKKFVVNPSLRLRTVPERQSSRKGLIAPKKNGDCETPFQYVCTPTAEELKPINSDKDNNDTEHNNHAQNSIA